MKNKVTKVALYFYIYCNIKNMEILKQACDGAGKAGLFVCCATCLAIPTVFATFLGIYAYNNPDQQAWYGIVDGK